MLSHAVPRLRLAAAAVKAAEWYAAENRRKQKGGDVIREKVDCTAPLWFDDTEQNLLAREQHVRSPAYRELHRPALTNAAMGLYGGEPGFEKAHRVWVDPDRPHIKHIYNQTALARNLRYARYGYFKRDMHLLDVDKLVRHARLLPTPGRLLTDFLYQRVPLPDKSCAALIRYQRQQIEMLEVWGRHASFQCAVEMFERMIVTNIPPVEVGVETHGEMVLCAAACGKWEEGWNVYANRARELEKESPESFILNTFFFDALLTLCVAAGRVSEGIDTLEEVIKRNLRPRGTMLNKAMILYSILGEQMSKHEASRATSEGERSYLCEPEEVEKMGLEVWSLFDFYQLPRTTASIEAYMRMCCAFNKPTLVLKAQGFADASDIRLSIECFHWLVYAIRGVAGFGDYVMDVLSQLRPRGLTPDFVLFTLSFMYCALQRDGELALAIFDQHFVHQNMNPTPEMVLLFIQACSNCEEPTAVMLERSETLIKRLEAVGSSVDLISPIYDQFLELCAHLGAVASGFSALKRIVGFGKPLTTRMINSLLLANSNAISSNGSLSMTEELVGFFTLLKIRPNADTEICVNLCRDAFGESPVVNDFIKVIGESLQGDSEKGEAPQYDEDIPVIQVPPHELRQLRTEWKLSPRDIVLRRFGQHTKPPGKAALDVGSMRGSVIPFGRSPGEQLV
uniref:mt-SAF7 (KRIPP10) n=1 Tax=Trypanosoma brucei brucei TaxID=5702 RepID=UPI00122C1334|nr:Chain F7, mt-SAF7 (KRIPP10) [Trypanosoma brucei brucei]6SGB_F7 Chain F7, mt-SAF7 (KRIPP10) [Trypanosoma brucei brucei]7PUA_F7 Chain F7, mt-SAF7 [Trypanosoma brucei brucei]7PUB_F7 Chain F7, mt-SAF7 [Trypanosoma brucei brucei]